MKPPLVVASTISTPSPSPSSLFRPPNSTSFPKPPTLRLLSFKSHFPTHRLRSFTLSSSNSPTQSNESVSNAEASENQWSSVEIRNARVPGFLSSWSSRFSLSDQGFFLLTFIACTTSAAFVGLVAAAVPTLYAMGRTAKSVAKLADTAREELPSTMAAIRLSGMEISDLTLELSDLSQEITEGVNKSAQVVQAAEVGIRQIGARACQQTASMIEDRANLPVISLQPVVSGAAKKTSRAVGNAARIFMNMFSRGESISENKEDDPH